MAFLIPTYIFYVLIIIFMHPNVIGQWTKYILHITYIWIYNRKTYWMHSFSSWQLKTHMIYSFREIQIVLLIYIPIHETIHVHKEKAIWFWYRLLWGNNLVSIGTSCRAAIPSGGTPLGSMFRQGLTEPNQLK